MLSAASDFLVEVSSKYVSYVWLNFDAWEYGIPIVFHIL